MPPFAARYRDAFLEYLEDRSERALGAAYELGRSAVADGGGILDLAEAHHAALRAALDRGIPEREVAECAAAFFREALATFEIALRGFLEAQETARLEGEHARRQEMLAEASLAVNATLSTDEILRVVAEQARRILEAQRAQAEVHLRRDVDPGAVAGNGAGEAPVQRAVSPEGAPPVAPGTPELAAPLTGRDGRPFGSLAVAGAARPVAAHEPIVTQLAQMASVAVENAQRYTRERQIAETLQRSLLPPRLPAIPGLDIAARFWPAGDGIQVGGDFYDVFPTGPQEWAIVIGDVCGKGPEAAALTALTRYTIRAAALHERRPSRVLEMLNEAMIEQRRDSRFATVLYLRLVMGPTGVKAIASSGGHPLPLRLHPSGRVDAIGGGGTLLGVVDDPALVDAEVDLSPGDTLVLYTDGVIEVRARGKELFGADDLTGLLGGCAGLMPDALLDRIEDQVLYRSGGLPQDDVALLGLRVQD